MCFANSLKAYAKPENIKELITILNRPESNPNIQADSLDVSQVNTDILILNPSAYKNIFKNYITESLVEFFKKSNFYE